MTGFPTMRCFSMLLTRVSVSKMAACM